MTAAIRAMCAKHADSLEAAANAMEADGVGGHPGHGHVVILRRMASGIRADGAVGKVPHAYEGAIYGSADGSLPPLPNPVLHTLRAAGIDLGLTGRISIGELDAAMRTADVAMDQRMAVKGELARIGRLD